MKKFAFFLFCMPLLLLGTGGCNQVSASLDPVIDEPAQVDLSIHEPEVVLEETVDPPADLEPDYCLDCHTDQQRLIDTAKPEEAVVSESSGEG